MLGSPLSVSNSRALKRKKYYKASAVPAEEQRPTKASLAYIYYDCHRGAAKSFDLAWYNVQHLYCHALKRKKY